MACDRLLVGVEHEPLERQHPAAPRAATGRPRRLAGAGTTLHLAFGARHQAHPTPAPIPRLRRGPRRGRRARESTAPARRRARRPSDVRHREPWCARDAHDLVDRRPAAAPPAPRSSAIASLAFRFSDLAADRRAVGAAHRIEARSASRHRPCDPCTKVPRPGSRMISCSVLQNAQRLAQASRARHPARGKAQSRWAYELQASTCHPLSSQEAHPELEDRAVEPQTW